MCESEAEPGVLFVSCEANNDLLELSVCTLNSSVSSFTFACEVSKAGVSTRR